MEHLTASDLPTAPPDGFMEWAEMKVLASAHVLLYRAGTYRDPLTGISERCVDATCSACGKKFKFDRVEAPACSYSTSSAPFGFMNEKNDPMIDGNHMLCPSCGAPVKVVHVGSFRSETQICGTYPCTVQAIQGRLVLFCWRVRRFINKSAMESTTVNPWLAYVVEDRRVNCFQAFWKCFYSVSQLDHWESRCRFEDKIGSDCTIFPWNKKILNGTTAENCKLDRYMKCNGELFPASYLKLWRRRPQVENLLMAGAGNLLARFIKDYVAGRSYCSFVQPTLSFINWREKRPAQMLGLSKEEFRAALSEKWDADIYHAYVGIKSRGEKVDPTDVSSAVKKLGIYDTMRLIQCDVPGIKILPSIRYILKQFNRDHTLSAGLLIDYWNMAQKNGTNLADPQFRYPQNLRRAHDQESARQRFAAQQAAMQKFVDREKSLDKYCFESDGLMIRPVRTPEELYLEGSTLHHCVYSYLDRHANGSTAILLIRHVDDPQSPFYTLELNERNMAVVQNRGLRNCGKTPEVQAFEDKWLAWAKAQQKGRRKQHE